MDHRGLDTCESNDPVPTLKKEYEALFVAWWRGVVKNLPDKDSLYRQQSEAFNRLRDAKKLTVTDASTTGMYDR